MRVVKFKYFPFLLLNPFPRLDVKLSIPCSYVLARAFANVRTCCYKEHFKHPPTYAEIIPTNTVNDSS